MSWSWGLGCDLEGISTNTRTKRFFSFASGATEDSLFEAAPYAGFRGSCMPQCVCILRRHIPVSSCWQFHDSIFDDVGCQYLLFLLQLQGWYAVILMRRHPRSSAPAAMA